MTPSALDGFHAHAPSGVRLRSLATNLRVDLEKSTAVHKNLSETPFSRRRSAFLVEVMAKINARSIIEAGTQPERCLWSLSLSQAPSYEAIFMPN